MAPTSSIKSILLSTLCIAVSSGPGALAHPTPDLEAPPVPNTTRITPWPIDLLLDPGIRKTHEFTVPCGCWNQCTLLDVATGGKLLAPENNRSNDTSSPFPACEPGWCIPDYMCRDDHDGAIDPVPDGDVPQEPNVLHEGDAHGARRSLQTSPKIDKRGCIWIVCCDYIPPRPDTDDIGGSIACTIDTDRWDQLF